MDDDAILERIVSSVADISSMDHEMASGTVEVELKEIKKELNTDLSESTIAAIHLDKLITSLAKTILQYETDGKIEITKYQVAEKKKEVYCALSNYNREENYSESTKMHNSIFT